MSGLTKEQLKNELVTHGIELPPASAKKEEYVRLYDKYVAPFEQSKGDFSSDDEDSPIVPLIENKEINMEQSLVINGLDISTLSDDDLFGRLQDLGAKTGPIVDSTRKVYQRKLLVLLGGDVVDSPTSNGDVDDDEYSDSEEAEEDKEEAAKHRPVQMQVTSPPPSQMTDIRQRILLSSGDSDIFDADRHTPSPRRSLRSVTSTISSSESTTVRKYFNNGRSGVGNSTAGGEVVSEESEEDEERKSKISIVVRLLVKILFACLILALILYIYQNDPNESPFKAVEQLARQALESAVGEEAEIKEGDPVDPVDAPATPPPTKAVPAV